MPSAKGLTRASTTLVAQVLSSLTNFAVAALALAASGQNLAGFGRFAIGLQLCQVIIAVAQSSTGGSLLVHGAQEGSRSPELEAVRAGAATASLVVGVAMGIPIAVAGLLVGGQQGQILLIVAIGAPWLAAQYTMREDRFARMQPQAVLRADAIWLLALVVAAMIDRFGGWDAGVKDYLAAWVIGAAVSAFPLVRRGLGPGRRHLGLFWRTTGSQAVKLGVEAFLARSVFVVTLISADSIIGSEAGGFLAAAVLVFSPMSVVHSSARALVVPTAVRRRGIHVTDWRFPAQVFAVISVITLAWASALWAFNMTTVAFGPFDLDANGVTGWLFVATLVRFLGMGFWRGPNVAMRVADAAHESLRSRVAGVFLQWTFPVVGLYLADLNGGAFGLAVATWCGGVIAWFEFVRIQTRSRVDA